MKEGLILRPHGVPRPPAIPYMPPIMRERVQVLVDDYIRLGAIVPCERHEVKLLSPVFAVPKASGGFRLVHNLRALNATLTSLHFRMEGIAMLRHLARKGDYFIKIDFENAYLHVAMEAESSQWLGFQIGSKVYRWVAMPFGLNIAPRSFTKLVRPVMAVLRPRGIRCLAYLDDLILMAHSEHQVATEATFVLDLLDQLGFAINVAKSALTPSQQVQYLGFTLDSSQALICVPAAKQSKIRKDLAGFLQLQSCSVRLAACMLGKLRALMPAVHLPLLRSRQLQYFVNQHIPAGWDPVHPIPEQVRHEVRDWEAFLGTWSGRTWLDDVPPVTSWWTRPTSVGGHSAPPPASNAAAGGCLPSSKPIQRPKKCKQQYLPQPRSRQI